MSETDPRRLQAVSTMSTLTRREFAKAALGATASLALLNTRMSVADAATNAIQTRSGKITGLVEEGLNVFRGIPYARPPVGQQRWLPPQPPEAWSGVYEAKAFKPIAPQPQMFPEEVPPAFADMVKALGASNPEPMDEDCLHLNIWTPGLDDARRPVMFWIHGGAFSNGSGSVPVYDGSVLATRGDVVVVTINYRLGALGFLNFNEITGGKIPATGNEGLLDQAAALEWVRDNIARFGGDPGNVLIFGESAGGMSVGALLGLPKARGLFHKAIPQSGACNTALSLEDAVKVTEIYLDLLGVKASDADALRSLSAEKLIEAQAKLGEKTGWTGQGQGISGMATQPVVDGKVLPSLPLDAVRKGSADGISILVGSTLEEWKLFSLMDFTVPGLKEEGVLKRGEFKLPAEDIQRIFTAYRDARAKRNDTTAPGEIFTAMRTDQVFRMPAVRLSEVQHGRNQPVYDYLFTWPSPAMNGRLGSCHALELGFVFGKLTDTFTGSGPKAQALATKIQDAWMAFARTGNPSCESLGAWPAYGDERETMILGDTCGVEAGPYDAERSAWDSVPDSVIGSL